MLKRITNDRLTALKLIAVLSMVIDHYNKFVNPEYNQAMFAVGRLALPLFVFVMAFNLARIEPGKMPKIAGRLVVFGLLAVPAYNAMGGAMLGGWWPLNILFLLAGFVMMVCLSKVQPASQGLLWASRAGVVAVFLVAGALAEFFWPGLLLGWGMYRLFCLFSPSENEENRIVPAKVGFALIALVLGVAGLLAINRNAWALVSVGVVLAVLYLPVKPLPRCKWFFYWFYPAHLWALWGMYVYFV